MSRMKFSRPSSAWLVLVCVRPRPVKPSIAKVADADGVELARPHLDVRPHAAGAVHQHDHRQAARGGRKPQLPGDVRRLGLGVAGEELLVRQASACGWREARSAPRCPAARLGRKRRGQTERKCSNGAGSDRRIMTFLPGGFSGIIAQIGRMISRPPCPMEIAKCPVTRATFPHGVIPAVILPFHDDLSIDEANFRKHLRDVTSAEGLSRRHHQRAFHGGGVLHLRRAEARARHRRQRDRRQDAAGQRHLGRRQPRSRAARQDGDRGRRLGAAGVSAGAVHDGPERRDGDRSTSSASPTPPTCR